MEEKNLQQQESQETDTPRYKQGAGMEEQGPAGHLHHGRILSGLSVLADVPRISRTTGSEQTIMIVSSILFAVIGLGGILFGLTAGWRAAIITSDGNSNNKEGLAACQSFFFLHFFKFLLLLRNLFLLLAQQAVDHRRGDPRLPQAVPR